MGRKDHQQLVVVRRLVAMQGHAVEVDAAPTVRDDDGVATSSRNRLLDDAARAVARRIPAALAAGVEVARGARAAGGVLDPVDVRDAANAVLAGDGLRIDYLETVDPERIVPIERPIGGLGEGPGGEAGEGPDARRVQMLLAVAAHVGAGEATVRLIDNVLLGDASDEQRLLDALAGTAEPRLGREEG
jgi:pantoate--beta-alanine ligase